MSFSAKNGKILSPFNPTPFADLVYYGGKTIPNLNFVNFYLGDWWDNHKNDMQNIDSSLSEAMSDLRLNSVVSQYFPGQQITSKFLGSGVVEVSKASLPSTVSQQFIEDVIHKAGNNGSFNNFDLSSTVFDFMLPGDTNLTNDQGQSSQDGLGGFHGSVNFQGADGKQKTAYYAIGVYSEDYSYLGVPKNGVPAFK